MNSSKSASPPTSASATSGAHKRRRNTQSEDAVPGDSPPAAAVVSPIGAAGAGGASSSFRNVSACNRCRLRKNRCDQRLPACNSCEKAAVRCVGYDPITKREIPRSYVYYLETRVAHLEHLLSSSDIPFPPAEEFSDLQPPPSSATAVTPGSATAPHPPALAAPTTGTSPRPGQTPIDPALAGTTGKGSQCVQIKRESSPARSDALEGKRLDSLVSDIGLVSFQGASDPRYLGSVSGISFARVVFAAVKSTTPGAKEEQVGNEASRGRRRTGGGGGGGAGGAGGGGGGGGGGQARVRGSRIMGAATKESPQTEEDADTQMRDSFFGLHTKPTVSPASFPARPLAERLVDLYFEHANPQIPSLHRGEFTKVLDTIYAPVEAKANGGGRVPSDFGVEGKGLGGTARERYLVNIVCAIGAGIFLSGPEEASHEDEDEVNGPEGPRKKRKVDPKDKVKQYEPEAYHAAAMLHMEAFLSQSKGGLEELQAVLLLAGFALLRPVSPGLWYIVGVALRLAVDLGLHYEDAEMEAKKPVERVGPKNEKEAKREWVRDMRRRLWWCVYTLDRLVSTCVGRPFGIADEVISTQFPSLLDDKYISPTTGITTPPAGEQEPSYKLISNHYLRLRLLQSEILQVLQQQSHAFSFASATSEDAFKRDEYKGKQNYPAHHPYHLQTPYLHNHSSLQAWHKDVDRRLSEWFESAPRSKTQTGVAFSPQFLELNYWQAKIMLYRPCLSVPVLLAGELGANNGNARSRAAEMGFGGGAELRGRGQINDEDRVYMIVAEAGGKVLRIYRQLHLVHQVNYTFLATHHLFMAGISFLYAIWHSPLVRSQLSMDEVDFTILAATSVLGDLIGKCPPAEACRDAFERMSRATVQMCLAGKKGPTSRIVPSGGAYSTQRMDSDERSQPHEQNPRQQRETYPEAYPQNISPAPHNHQRMLPPATDPHPPNRRHQIHFDDGFQDLFTSPRPAHASPYPHREYPSTMSPTTPTADTRSMFHHPPQNPFPMSHTDMMIDPSLQHAEQFLPMPSEWASIDMAQFGIPGFADQEWEPDGWSEEGSTEQVDLFDGFFFGNGS